MSGVADAHYTTEVRCGDAREAAHCGHREEYGCRFPFRSHGDHRILLGPVLSADIEVHVLDKASYRSTDRHQFFVVEGKDKPPANTLGCGRTR